EVARIFSTCATRWGICSFKPDWGCPCPVSLAILVGLNDLEVKELRTPVITNVLNRFWIGIIPVHAHGLDQMDYVASNCARPSLNRICGVGFIIIFNGVRYL